MAMTHFFQPATARWSLRALWMKLQHRSQSRDADAAQEHIARYEASGEPETPSKSERFTTLMATPFCITGRNEPR